MSDNQFEKGMEIRKAVLGQEHVARAEANKTDLDTDFQKYITENVWGSIWSRPGMEKKTRHLVTLAILASLNYHEELAMHIRATKNTGVTADELKEVLLHVAAYGGVPAANTAFSIAKKVFAEIENQS